MTEPTLVLAGEHIGNQFVFHIPRLTIPQRLECSEAIECIKSVSVAYDSGKPEEISVELLKCFFRLLHVGFAIPINWGEFKTSCTLSIEFLGQPLTLIYYPFSKTETPRGWVSEWYNVSLQHIIEIDRSDVFIDFSQCELTMGSTKISGDMLVEATRKFMLRSAEKQGSFRFFSTGATPVTVKNTERRKVVLAFGDFVESPFWEAKSDHLALGDALTEWIGQTVVYHTNDNRFDVFKMAPLFTHLCCIPGSLSGTNLVLFASLMLWTTRDLDLHLHGQNPAASKCFEIPN
jgi:hypothetical protein